MSRDDTDAAHDSRGTADTTSAPCVRTPDQSRSFVYPILVAALMLVVYGAVFMDLMRVLIADSESSHGLLVIPLSGYLIWRKRADLTAAPKRPNAAALPVVLLGALLLPLGIASDVGSVRFLSMLIVLGGVMWHVYGSAAIRVILFPYLFLAFAIPWPGLLVETLTFPLQLLAARAAAAGIGLLGVDVVRDGVQIEVGGTPFAVDAPCSGMHSLAALLALGALSAYLFRGSLARRALLFLAVPPLALAGNAVRIVVILLIALRWGSEAASGFYHGFSGVIVFLVTFALLLLLARLLGLRQLREVF